MSRNRFYKIAAYLHFVDNEAVTEDQRKQDRVWKLRPWLTSLRDNFGTVSSSEEHQCIDEIMVAFKGRSALKQYMQKKPKKWGFKLWARCSSSEFCHDFAVYQGKGTGMDEQYAPNCGLGGNVVLQLCESLLRNHQYKIFSDNYFTNFEMVVQITKRNYGQFLGTIQTNRCHKAPLKTEKQLALTGRGSMDSVYEKDRNLVVVRWNDNKSVTLLSTYIGTEPIDTVKRYDKAQKKHIEVERPAVVKMYNSNMGGVDLLDMMCTLYKRQLKSKRWYLYIFYHTLTICMVNAWFLCRRDCKLTGTNVKLALKKFQATAADALIKKGKPNRGRPSATFLTSPPAKKQKVTPAPVADVRYDLVDHWPVQPGKRNRCRFCPAGFSWWQCSKCKVHLCICPDRNCFFAYHHK
ncbi:piggyBac transposable element-derived protein 3-like [Liolophura sinensis]|uniref:piggyBac transposable element-derived protein 3-like n=1 Tax=Liolophura sinensis TaxID=3198878 RepID=UPI0031592E8A